MAEDKPTGLTAGAHQSRLLCGRDVVDSLTSGRCLEDPQVSGAIQCREQEQPAGGGGKIGSPGCEQCLQAPTEWQGRRQRLGRGALRAGERRREFEQGERVPLRLCQNPPANLWRQLGKTGADQAVRRLLAQRVKLVLRQPGALEEALISRPRRSQETGAAAGQAAGDEPEHPGAGPVKPRQIIDDDQHRAGGGHVPQHRERRGGHQQPIRGRPLAVAQGDVQRVPMRDAELPELIEQRKQGLVQPGKGQIGLELHPGGPQHHSASLGCRVGRRVQQGRLTGAWLSDDQQCAPAGPGLLDKRAH